MQSDASTIGRVCLGGRSSNSCWYVVVLVCFQGSRVCNIFPE